MDVTSGYTGWKLEQMYGQVEIDQIPRRIK